MKTFQEMTATARPPRRAAVAVVALGALLAGCAQISPPAARPGEDPYDQIFFADYTSVAASSRGVRTAKPRVWPRWVFFPSHLRPKQPTPIRKLHPELLRKLHQWGGVGPAPSETLVVTFEERIDLNPLPRPPSRPRRDLHALIHSPLDTTGTGQLFTRTGSTIDSLVHERRIKYEVDSTAIVAQYGGTVLRTSWLAPSMLVVMPLNRVSALAQRGDVVYIRPNLGNPPPQGTGSGSDVIDARRQIGSDHYRKMLGGGNGWIAILDTGVRTKHRLFLPETDETPICKIEDCVTGSCVYSYAAGNVCDSKEQVVCDGIDCDASTGGHGTSTAAVIAGVGSETDPINDPHTGMTTASLDCFRVYNARDSLEAFAAIAAFQLAVARHNRVIVAEMQEITAGDIAIEADNAYKLGFLVVAPTGDLGLNPAYADKIGVPASEPRVVGVADYKVQDASKALVAGHQAGAVGTLRFKPDILAPSFTNTAGDNSNEAIHAYNATSGAAPYAAGAASLLWDWMAFGGHSVDPGHVFAQLILAADTPGPYAENNKQGAGPITLPTGGYASWGMTWVSSDAAFVDVPIEVDHDGLTAFDAAIWWPEETNIYEGFKDDTHNDLDLEVRSPGIWDQWLGGPAAESDSRAGVFERATFTAAAGRALSKGTWLLRIVPKTMKASPQTVYWAVHYH